MAKRVSNRHIHCIIVFVILLFVTFGVNEKNVNGDGEDKEEEKEKGRDIRNKRSEVKKRNRIAWRRVNVG